MNYEGQFINELATPAVETTLRDYEYIKSVIICAVKNYYRAVKPSRRK